MRPDFTTKALLFVIAVLLCIMTFRPDLSPTPAHAATQIQYKVITQKVESFEELEEHLNILGREGWSLVSIGIGPMVFMRYY
jgi:hypothetical protein